MSADPYQPPENLEEPPPERLSKVRVHCKGLPLDEGTFPPECPSCLAVPADHLVLLRSASKSMTWPHCQSCARLEASSNRWRVISIVGTLAAVLLFLVGPYAAKGGGVPRALGPALPWCAGALLVLAWVLPWIQRRSRTPTPGAPVAGAGVKLRYAGKHMLAGGYEVQVVFFNEDYAREFLEQNEPYVHSHDLY